MNKKQITGLTIDDPAYFDRLAEVEAVHWWSLGMWRIAAWWLAGALRGQRGLCALDVGCGTGMGVVRLSRRPEIAHVVGLDPSPAALGHARTRHEFPLVLGSALALPFDSGRFDVVTCFDVLQHLPACRMLDAALELRRVLRPGGIALLRSNNEPSTAAGSRLDHLRTIVMAADFAVRRASHANCLPALGQELRTRLARVDRCGHPAGGGLQIRLPHPWVNRMMGGVAAAEGFVVGRLSATLPYGHSTMVLAQAVSLSGGLDANRN